MNFLLSEQQIELQDQLRRMVEETCGLRALHKHIDSEDGFHAALWRQLVEFGAAGTCLPEADGGLGLEMIDLALIAETLGHAAAPTPFFGHALAGLAIAMGGSPAQKAAWLPQLATGQALGTIAFAEGNGEWQPEEWRLAAAPALTGEKQNVPNALEAQIIVVGLAGGALGLVETGAKGVVCERFDSVDRTRRLDMLRFENAAVEMLPEGKAVSGRLRDAALVLLAADAFGGATRCVEMATAYAKEREQFGVKIAQFQALRHQLANMALEAEPGRGLYWFAAHAFDHMPQKSSAAAAIAKAHIADRFLQIGRDNIEAHGGIGYTWEYDAHIWLKRAMFDWVWCGNPSVHRRRYADLVGW